MILVTFRQKVGLPNKVRIRKGSQIVELEKVQALHDLEKVLGELEKVPTAT